MFPSLQKNLSTPLCRHCTHYRSSEDPLLCARRSGENQHPALDRGRVKCVSLAGVQLSAACFVLSSQIFPLNSILVIAGMPGVLLISLTQPLFLWFVFLLPIARLTVELDLSVGFAEPVVSIDTSRSCLRRWWRIAARSEYWD